MIRVCDVVFVILMGLFATAAVCLNWNRKPYYEEEDDELDGSETKGGGMFKLTVETRPSLLDGRKVQIDTYFTINDDKTFQLTEVIPDDIGKDKELFVRMIDKQLYEMKKQVRKYLAIKEGE